MIMSPDHTALVILPVEAGNSLLEAAEMEFQATLQLLVDRACWVSGAGSGEIVLEDEGELRYAAVSGDSEHEPGTKVTSSGQRFSQVLSGQFARDRGMNETGFRLISPISQDDKAVGFLGLTSSHEFGKDSEAILSGIAKLVAVALGHRDAAERAERLEFRDNELELPSLWSAPENAEPKKRVPETQEIAAKSATEVGTCKVCGFPISPGRALCVECELKPESATEKTANHLFKSASEESWFSAHGYTIASLVVTALTAAIILWLRH
jgi:hypothetical protein